MECGLRDVSEILATCAALFLYRHESGMRSRIMTELNGCRNECEGQSTSYKL